MSKMFNNYIGKAGQLFAMSEFLTLGYNVAIPEVDRGDDIFVVRDTDGTLSRVQVKTAQINTNRSTITAQFNLPREQLNSSPTPEITYILLIRNRDKWQHLFAIQRRDLADILAERLEKNSEVKNINLSLTITNENAKCGKIDFSIYQKLSDLFPKIFH